MSLHFCLIFCPTTRPSNYNNTRVRCMSAVSSCSLSRSLQLKRLPAVPARPGIAGSNAICFQHCAIVLAVMSLQPCHVRGLIMACPEYGWNSLPSWCGSCCFAVDRNQTHLSDCRTCPSGGEPVCWTSFFLHDQPCVSHPFLAPLHFSLHHGLPRGRSYLFGHPSLLPFATDLLGLGRTLAGKSTAPPFLSPSVEGCSLPRHRVVEGEWRTWIQGDGERHPRDHEHNHRRMAMRAATETKEGVDVDKRWKGPGGSFASARRRGDGGRSTWKSHVWRVSRHDSCAMQAMQRCRKGWIGWIHAQKHRQCLQGGGHLLDGDGTDARIRLLRGGHQTES